MSHSTLQGRITKLEVWNPRAGKWEARGGRNPNLILDQGLDNLADRPICDLFAFAVKGTGSTANTEVFDLAGAYTWNGTTLTRTAGTRDFVIGDEGKLVKFSSGGTTIVGKIVTYTSVTVVTMDTTHSSVTGGDLTLYTVEDTELDSEVNQTLLVATLTKPLSDATVTSTAPVFSAGDVGRAIYFPSVDFYYLIASYTSTTVVEVTLTDDFDITETAARLYDINSIEEAGVSAARSSTYSLQSGDNGTVVTIVTVSSVHYGKKALTRSFIFPPELTATPEDLTADTYTHNGTTVTRTAGTRDFVPADVGKVLSFTNDVETKITAYSSATVVTVETNQSPSATGLHANLYPYITYNEVGFSHSEFPGDNLNIRVVLAAGVKVVAPTVFFPGEQLKVTYELDVTVLADRAAFNLGSGSNKIVDPNTDMSSNKQGFFAIESFQTSIVESDGSTDIGAASLEPFEPGFLAFSLSTTAIGTTAPNYALQDPDRSSGVATTELVAQTYTPGNKFRDYIGTFQTNEAIGGAWRSLMLYEPESGVAVMTYLFNVVQRKDADKILSITIRKTWDRDVTA